MADHPNHATLSPYAPYSSEVLRRVEVNGLWLTETIYPASLEMLPHAHEHAYISLTLQGA